MRGDKIAEKYLLVILLIIQTSGASIIATSDIFIVASTVWSLVVHYRRAPRIDSFHFFSLIIFGIICLAYLLINEAIDINSWLGIYMKLIFSYNVISIVGPKFPEYLISTVKIISIISLIGFILQLIIPTLFYDLNNFANLGKGNNSNSIIFNFSLLHRFRNCGPMWEPGVYAALLTIALYLNGIIRSNLLFQKINLPIFLALISTFSTTGYVSLLIIIFMHLTRKKSFGLLTYLLFIPILLIGYNLEFGYNKIEDQYLKLDDELNTIKNNSSDYRMSISRFASYAVDLKVLMKRPIIGYGADILTTNAKVYYADYGPNINRSSGIMLLLVRFGIFGSIIYFYFLYRSLYLYSNRRNAAFGLIFVIIILFSSPIMLSPLIFIFFFINSKNLKKVNTGNQVGIKTWH